LLCLPKHEDFHMTALLELEQITCKYRGQTIVRKLDLHVNKGDIFCLLGPSGCGKTTVLRAIAGFEPVYEGKILHRDQVISSPNYSLAPEKRHIGMVFQDYALFPHMNVCCNVAFGLSHLPKEKRYNTANEMLEVVGLAGYGHRYIHELSGGQQQRVALARALAPQPDLILLDEPFSNLDVEMREHLSQEVRQILKSQGTTGILVTHDQMEAFAVGDQIGVMNNGEILQKDSAYNLYHSPDNLFVADFIGQGVFLHGKLLAPDTVETNLGIIVGDRAYDWPLQTPVQLLLRPDDLVADEQGHLSGKVIHKAFKGAEIMYTLKLSDGTEVLTLFPSHHDHALGDTVKVRLAPEHMVIFKAGDLSNKESAA